MSNGKPDGAKLDAMVRKLGDYVETNYNELVNPKHSTARSTIATVFRAVVGGSPLLHKTAKELDLPVTGWHTTLDKIIDAMEARGSTAANKVEGAIKQIRFAKKNPQG